MAVRISYLNVIANLIQTSREAYWVRCRLYCSRALKPNPLSPSTSYSSIKDVVAIDCEMVGVRSLLGEETEKSALARVTLMNEHGKVVYDEYVRPVGTVVNFRTWVSGIRRGDLEKGIDFNDAQKKVAEMIHGKILVGHALNYDLKVLQLSHPEKDIRDTSKYAPYLEEGRQRQSLKKLVAEVLNVKIQNGEHCSAVDACAAMMLYQKKKEQWENEIWNAKEAETDEGVLNAQGTTKKEKKILRAQRKTESEILNAGKIEEDKRVLSAQGKTEKENEILNAHGMAEKEKTILNAQGKTEKKKGLNVEEKQIAKEKFRVLQERQRKRRKLRMLKKNGESDENSEAQ